MSDIITVRDSDIVAAEINTIKEDTRRVMIANAIRIGGKLTEAKSLVPFGEWGKWLEEKVEYSQSTAEDLMKLYREYGDNQESLFDTWTKSETFGNLSYSKHLALLALPFAQRQEFAEQNNVEEMSTRELNQAIKEELEATKEHATELENQLKGAQKLAETRLEALADAKTEAERLRTVVDSAKEQLQQQTESVEDLKAKVKKAKDNEKAAKEKLKQALEKPEIPESVMEQMRQQVAADAAQKATEDLQKQLAAAQSKTEELAKVAREAEDKLAAAQKAMKMADPAAVAFKVKFERIQNDLIDLRKDLAQIRQSNQQLGEGFTSAVRKLLENQLADLEIGK